MNEFQFLQWFLAEQFGEQLKSIVAKGGDIVTNLSKLNERINLMEANLKAQIDELKAQAAADSEQKAKVLGEIKDVVKKLADALAGSSEAIKAAVDAAVSANNAEVSSALAEVKAANDASIAATKELDDQIADLTPAPAV